jgi:hypothetical protein
MPEVAPMASDPTMANPGWSNNPAGPASPTPTEQTPLFPPAGFSNSGAAATGATAGTPGTYTPAGAIAPLSLSALTGVTASPPGAWTTGQYVVTRDGQYAHWSNAAWVNGKA